MDYNYNNLRSEAIRKYGGKCVSCGFSDWRALQFDHVNSEGREHRNFTRKHSFLAEIIADTSGRYQLLCANCNQIKKYTHREGVSARANEQILATMRRFQRREELVISFC